MSNNIYFKSPSLSSDTLKLAAVLSMLIDHTGLLFFPQHQIFRIIGRVSFPIYCFLLVQGFIYTKSRRRYAIRLFLFGAVSVVPYQLFTYRNLRWHLGGSINVMFGLLTGLAVMAILEHSEKGYEIVWMNKIWKCCSMAVSLMLCFVAELLSFSYGAYGIFLIAGFYLFRKSREHQCLAMLLCAFADSVIKGPSLQIYAVFSCFFLWCYNGKKGRALPKYVFYVFYPAHLLLLYGAYRLIFINNNI